MNKRPLIVWSGGLDSTAIIGSAYKDNEPIDIVYIEIKNNIEKTKVERKAINDIISEFDCKYQSNIICRRHELVYPEVRNCHRQGLTLPIMWLSSLALMIDEYISEIRFGYIKDDCFWHIKHDFERAFYHLCKIGNHSIDPPKLVYPLEWYTKQNVYDYWYNEKDDIFKMKSVLPLIWTCENPKKIKGEKELKPCEECSKCKEYNNLIKE